MTETAKNTANISIIIVTYNAAGHLQKCLDSIYKQKYAAINIIVIDGESSDGTRKILQDNAKHIHFWVSENDSGIYDAMNKALKHVKGNWIYFLGSDDELLPDFSKLALELTDHNAIYYANVMYNGEKKSGELSAYFMAKVGIYHQAIIYPRAVFEKYQYAEKYKIAADYALNMQCYSDKNFYFIYKEYIIAQYNHTGISARFIDKLFEKDKAALILQNFGFKIWSRFKFRQLKKVLFGDVKG